MLAIAQARLYGICDLGYVSADDALRAATELLEGGVDLLQLRAKNQPLELIETLARQLQPLCRQHHIPFILNDHFHLALRLAADHFPIDGLHLGQDDGDLAAARAQLPPGTLLGRSTHSLAQARAALAEGADYLGFGPLFATQTKPGRPAISLEDLATVEQEIGSQIPVFCIGGINRKTLPQVLAAGARRVCVVSDLLQSQDRTSATRQIKAMLKEGTPQAL